MAGLTEKSSHKLTWTKASKNSFQFSLFFYSPVKRPPRVQRGALQYWWGLHSQVTQPRLFGCGERFAGHHRLQVLRKVFQRRRLVRIPEVGRTLGLHPAPINFLILCRCANLPLFTDLRIRSVDRGSIQLRPK